MTPRPGSLPRDRAPIDDLAADVVAGLDRADRLDALARDLRALGESGAAAAAIRCAHRERRQATFLRELASELDAVYRRR